MKILAHRGLWRTPEERNSLDALARAFRSGFGVEIDVRDHGGRLVISHDPPVFEVPLLENLLQLHQEICGGALTLAINIKSDGLHDMVKRAVEDFRLTDYFVFDMSVPDLIAYKRHGIRFFSRLSEFEPKAIALDEAAGIWVDCFHTTWVKEEDLSPYLDGGKEICMVSPELHGREKGELWDRMRTWTDDHGRFSLCTDFPSEAERFFSR